MYLWNYIYGFLTEHIFVSSGDHADLNVNVGNGNTLKLYEWLATTGTVIILVIICITLGLFVRWLFRLTAGLIRGN